MKTRKLLLVPLILFGCVVLAIVLIQGPGHKTNDLAHWLRIGAGTDWHEKAAAGDARAQYLLGLEVIRTNLILSVDRVPVLSKIPVLGRRFQEVRFAVDASIPPGRLIEAHDWIKQAANQGYAPALEGLKLFEGRLPSQSAPPPAP